MREAAEVTQSLRFRYLQTFSENPYLKASKLWKQVTYDDQGEPQVTASPLEWKETTEAKDAAEFVSFFEV